MRRYMQGTLDFACGVYAVINALSCTYGLDLANARKIFQETVSALSKQERLWLSFLRNETDQYWLVRWLLGRWCLEPPWRLEIRQPFSGCLYPEGRGFDAMELYLPETHEPNGPGSLSAARDEASAVWDTLHGWFSDTSGLSRTALLRFHRFIPGTRRPVVSHWTTAHTANAKAIVLHDASSEPGALFALERESLLPGMRQSVLLRIVPESVVLLSRSPQKGGLPGWPRGSQERP